jgi:hypothetical protein
MASKPASPLLFKFSIYTIVLEDKLKAAVENDLTTFQEGQAWTSGSRLLAEAKEAGEDMPVVFADAADCSRLLYWGILTDVVVKDNTTQYSVKSVQEINGQHSPQELLLKSTGNKIRPNFIRPYAICETPLFLAAPPV